jgi:hypothetical protein
MLLVLGLIQNQFHPLKKKIGFILIISYNYLLCVLIHFLVNLDRLRSGVGGRFLIAISSLSMRTYFTKFFFLYGASSRSIHLFSPCMIDAGLINFGII